jgi:hypothetical protein
MNVVTATREMSEDPFSCLRATFYRRAQMRPDVWRNR